MFQSIFQTADLPEILHLEYHLLGLLSGLFSLEFKLLYNEMQTFLVSFNKHKDTCNPQSSQDINITLDPETPSLSHPFSILRSQGKSLFVSHHRKALPILELHIKRIIHNVFFWVRFFSLFVY